MKITRAQVARIQALEGRTGQLRASDIVEDAKKKTSPLHSLFDWNVRRAAEAHWKEQAREIIRSVKMVVETTHYRISVPAYVRDPGAPLREEGYRRVATLKSDREASRAALITALEAANGHLQRCYDLAAGLGLSGEVDVLLDKVAGFRRSLEEVA